MHCMSKWLAGRVVGQTRWTERLFSLRVEASLASFEAGQFTKLALDIGGERVARPYSLVNPPGAGPLEFYYNVVESGPLSPRLAALAAGDQVFVAPNPAGFLVLREVPEAENLWLIATGTGLGPFLSILRTAPPWQRFRKVTLVHATRTVADQAYRPLLAEIARGRGGQFATVSFVSREAAEGALAGRVPAAIGDGRLEVAAAAPLSADRSQVMLCGNPEMVRDVTTALEARGMRKHRRRAPGHITVETYW
jgi:ferredoxin--NADP+ reductase